MIYPPLFLYILFHLLAHRPGLPHHSVLPSQDSQLSWKIGAGTSSEDWMTGTSTLGPDCIERGRQRIHRG